MRYLAIFSAVILIICTLACPGIGPEEQLTVNPDDYEHYDILTQMDGVIGDARFICFGESSHVLSGIHNFANELFRYLVEKHGVRVFVFESAWGVDEVIGDFIVSDRTEPEGWENLFLNAFSSRATLETLRFIRAYNKAHPDDTIRVAGYQPEQPVLDYSKLVKTLEKSGVEIPAEITSSIRQNLFSGNEFATDSELIGFNSSLRRENKRVLTDDQLANLMNTLDELSSLLKNSKDKISASTSDVEYEETVLRVFSIRSYADILIRLSDAHPATMEEANVLTNKMYEEGDAARFHVFKTLLNTRYQGKRFYLWMHDWHAAKRSPEISFLAEPLPGGGATSLGTLMFNEYGDDYVVFGNITGYKGEDREEREDVLDRAFSAAFGDEAAFIDFSEVPEAHSSLPLDQALPIYVHHAHSYFNDLNLMRQFDGVVYLPHSGFTYEENR